MAVHYQFVRRSNVVSIIFMAVMFMIMVFDVLQVFFGHAGVFNYVSFGWSTTIFVSALVDLISYYLEPYFVKSGDTK